ncbi:MAG TPA: DUF3592 domain-containing protein [Sedimentisphaerales bacterium]|nr:DUF3592 domain-containing protein [Sedimentisphaerales bacterium]HNU30662.1 DUF3592 domain-containing protein [Sedimentisphaerales bacterium]
MKKRGSSRLVLLGVGALLVFLGLRVVAVRVAGTVTQGVVTDVRQIVSDTSDKMDHNYRISYRFAVNGKDYAGNLDRKKVYNTSTLPAVGSAVAVRYIPTAPFLNGAADANPLMGIALGALGLLVGIAGLRTGRRSASEPVSEPNAPVA